MKTRTLFIFNLLASVFYFVTQHFYSELIDNVILLLLVFLFFYTSQKIRGLNNDNPYLISRLIINLASSILILTIFRESTNLFLFRLVLMLVILGVEAYELLLKNTNYSKIS